MDKPQERNTLRGRKERPKVPPANRKRIAQACNLCKKRRRKCELAQDHHTCMGCQDDGFECIFESAGSDENLRRAGRDRKLMNTAVNSESSGPPLYDHVAGRFMQVFPEQQRSGQQVEVLHSILTFEGNTYDQRKAPNESRSFQPSQHADGTHDHRVYLTLAEVFTALPNWNRAEALLNTFFLYAEANYYYFDGISFRTRIAELYRDGLQNNANDIDFVTLALMTFALGSYFSEIRSISRCPGLRKIAVPS